MRSGENFGVLKEKMAYFCALLSIDFKVCRLITETVFDCIKTVTNRLFSSPFSEPQRQEPGSIATADTSSTFCTLHYRTAQGIAVDISKWKDVFKSP